MSVRIHRAPRAEAAVDAELIGRAQRGDEGAFASLAVAAGD
jgi:hypothetical protein